MLRLLRPLLRLLLPLLRLRCCSALATASSSDSSDASLSAADAAVGPASASMLMELSSSRGKRQSLKEKGKAIVAKLRGKLVQKLEKRKQHKQEKAAAKAQKKQAKADAKAQAKQKKADKKQRKKQRKAEAKAEKKRRRAAKKHKRKQKLKKAAKALGRAASKLGHKVLNKAEKMAAEIKKIAKRAVRVCKAKSPKLKGNKLSQCIERMKRAGIRLLRKKLGLATAIEKVKRNPTRANISKAQHLLKKHRAGPRHLQIGGHRIRLKGRSPRPKKQKKFKSAQDDANYQLYLQKQQDSYKRKIANLKLQEHALRNLKNKKKDWPIKYALLDPPDKSQQQFVKRFLSDLKPFLKSAVAVKQGTLNEGRQGLVTMEKLRHAIRDKLDEAKGLPLLPEMYRFLG